jgi:hypothetical protein
MRKFLKRSKQKLAKVALLHRHQDGENDSDGAPTASNTPAGKKLRGSAAKKTKHHNSEDYNNNSQDENDQKQEDEDEDQGPRRVAEHWMENASKLAIDGDYYEAIQEFTSLQERILEPEINKVDAYSSMTSSKLWATRQNADINFVVGKLNERLGDENVAADFFKKAYQAYEKLPSMCLMQREEEHEQLDQPKTKKERSSMNHDHLRTRKDLVFHSDTQSILVLEAMGSLAVKREQADLATEFYDMVDDLLRNAERKYAQQKYISTLPSSGSSSSEGDDYLISQDSSNMNSSGDLSSADESRGDEDESRCSNGLESLALRDGDRDHTAAGHNSITSSRKANKSSKADSLREYRKDRARQIHTVKRLIQADRARTSKIYTTQMKGDDASVMSTLGNVVLNWLGGN